MATSSGVKFVRPGDKTRVAYAGHPHEQDRIKLFPVLQIVGKGNRTIVAIGQEAHEPGKRRRLV